MEYGYDEILLQMKDTYEEMTGSDADEVSDAGIMLRLLAGELFSLNADIDWLKRAMFISTAQGEALELHARQRGIERRTGSKAVGTILVRVDSPLEYDVVIPRGTVFSTSDGALRYISATEAIIYSGTGSTFVDVEAQYTGRRYNIESGLITTVVTYFSSGISVTNSSAFTGGSDDETDAQLRERLISSFSKLSNGLNYAYYKKLAESVDGVYSANVSEIQQGSRTMNVYVAGKGAAADNSTIAEVQSLMNENRIPGVYIMVVSAILTSKNVSVALTIKNGYSVPKTLSTVTAAIREHFEGMRVGQSFIAAELGAKIIAVPGVENYTFTNTADAVANSSTLFTAGTLSVERSVSS